MRKLLFMYFLGLTYSSAMAIDDAWKMIDSQSLRQQEKEISPGKGTEKSKIGDDPISSELSEPNFFPQPLPQKKEFVEEIGNIVYYPAKYEDYQNFKENHLQTECFTNILKERLNMFVCLDGLKERGHCSPTIEKMKYIIIDNEIALKAHAAPHVLQNIDFNDEILQDDYCFNSHILDIARLLKKRIQDGLGAPSSREVNEQRLKKLNDLIAKKLCTAKAGILALGNEGAITSLDLRDNQIDNGVAKALAAHSSLTSLNLDRNQIGDEGAIALAAHSSLTSLNLDSNQIGDEGAKALAAHSSLTSLNLGYNQIGKEGAIALAANTTLTSLNLDSNQIGDEGVIALAANTTLTSLNLDSNQIGDEGAIAFADNTTLTDLNLYHNQIGNEGARALAANSSLRSLNLNHNQIGNEGAKALAANSSLTDLNLYYNQIGNEGARALAANSSLRSLNLGHNQIGNEGAIAFADNATLTYLNLHSNQIGNEGAIAFADNTTLTYLNLDYNQIDNDLLTTINSRIKQNRFSNSASSSSSKEPDKSS